MAELTSTTAGTEASSCCSPQAQASCCEPAEKGDCCTPEAATCGCSASGGAGTDIREAVRERYAAAAATGCCDPVTRTTEFSPRVQSSGI